MEFFQVYVHPGDYSLGIHVHTLGYSLLPVYCPPQSEHTEEEHDWEDGHEGTSEVYHCIFLSLANKNLCDSSATEDSSWGCCPREGGVGIPAIKRLLYHFNSQIWLFWAHGKTIFLKAKLFKKQFISKFLLTHLHVSHLVNMPIIYQSWSTQKAVFMLT